MRNVTLPSPLVINRNLTRKGLGSWKSARLHQSMQNGHCNRHNLGICAVLRLRMLRRLPVMSQWPGHNSASVEVFRIRPDLILIWMSQNLVFLEILWDSPGEGEASPAFFLAKCFPCGAFFDKGYTPKKSSRDSHD